METNGSNKCLACMLLQHHILYAHVLTSFSSADAVAEDPTMSWEFFVEHYEDTEQAYRDSKYTWRTIDNEYYVGTNPPEGAEPLGILYPRAGTLGGCGNHNALNLALPPDENWDHIANLTGDASWSAETMRDYFQQIENNQYIKSNGTEMEGHGFDGWLRVRCSQDGSNCAVEVVNTIKANVNQIDLFDRQPGFIEYLQKLSCAVGVDCPTTREATYKLLQRDLNTVRRNRYEQAAIYQLPLHYDGMRRRSSSQTYLRDTVNELNHDGTPRFPLTISTNSLATRVLFDTLGETPRATGVAYLQGQALYKADQRNNGLQVGQPHNVTATREVIVSGGAFNTPQILKLSGIGPREELESFNITIVKELPAVGENLKDNYEAGIHVEAATDHGNLFEGCTRLAPGDPCFSSWVQNGTGPYGLGAAPAAFLFRSSVSENNDTDVFLFGGAGVVFDGFYPGYSTPRRPLNSSFWSLVKMQYQNTAGTVRLRSADPQDMPLINFRYFAEGRKHDLQALREAMEFMLARYDETAPPYGPYTVINPDPSIDINQAIMDQTFSHHAQSSCAIGMNDTDSCVDSRFRVHGVDALRIVDASVFPRPMGGFPVLPTFLIGTKASHVILEDAGV